jgi:DNA-binding NarL/FixJ family response regulator
MMRNAFSQDRASHNGDLVAFPSAMERPQSAAQPSSPAPSTAPSGVSAIVVIDRRALIRECLARSLATASGCRVVAFASADAWMSAEVEGEPSLVLFSTASLQRDMETQRQMALVAEACPAMPIVVMSDGDDADHIVEALDKGMRGYIPTGVTLEVALGAIGLGGQRAVHGPPGFRCGRYSPRQAEQDHRL